MYQTLVEEAQKTPTGTLPIRVNFILEELCNTIHIPEFSKKLTVARSRNIRIYSVIQDFGQLQESYKEQAATIKANMNLVYLLTNEYQTAREISNRIGKYTIITTRTSSSNRYGKADFHLSADSSLTGRDLLTPDELMNFKFGEALFLMARIDPVKSNLKQIKDYPIKYKIVNNIKVKHKDFYKLEVFDLDTFRIEKELFKEEQDIPKTKPTKKANPTRKNKDNGG